MNTIFTMEMEEQQKLPFIVKGIGVQFNQEHIYRADGFPYYHWAHCETGEGKLLIGGNEYKITPEMGFFFRPGIPHEYYSLKEPWEIRWLIFDGPALPTLLSYLAFPKWSIVNIIDKSAIDRTFANIHRALTEEGHQKILKSSSLLYDFLIEMKNSTQALGGGQNEKTMQLLPVISYMENNYNKYTSVEDMASLIGVTPYHLCRLFKDAFNLSPFKYLTGLRIQEAKGLLVSEPDMAVKDIALAVGYNDSSYFCSVFKKHEAMTPLEFRKIHGMM